MFSNFIENNKILSQREESSDPPHHLNVRKKRAGDAAENFSKIARYRNLVDLTVKDSVRMIEKGLVIS